MKRRAKILIVTMLCLDSVLATAELVQGYAYKDADGASTEIIDICKVTTESVSCWNPDGNLDPHFTRRVESYFIDDANAVIKRRLGKDSRLIFVSYRQNESGGYWNAQLSLNNEQLNDSLYLQQTDFRNRISGFWLFVDDTSKPAEAHLDVSQSAITALTPFRKGEATSINGRPVRVLDISPQGASEGDLNPSKNSHWKVEFDVPAEFTKPELPLQLSLFDLNGEQVSGLTAKGELVRSGFGTNEDRILPLFTYISKRSVILNADPERFGFFQFSSQTRTRKDLSPIQLNPKDLNGSNK